MHSVFPLHLEHLLGAEIDSVFGFFGLASKAFGLLAQYVAYQAILSRFGLFRTGAVAYLCTSTSFVLLATASWEMHVVLGMSRLMLGSLIVVPALAGSGIGMQLAHTITSPGAWQAPGVGNAPALMHHQFEGVSLCHKTLTVEVVLAGASVWL